MALGPHDSWCYGTRTGRPQVIENSSATAMLGLAGMAVLAVSEGDREVEYAIETAPRVSGSGKMCLPRRVTTDPPLSATALRRRWRSCRPLPGDTAVTAPTVGGLTIIKPVK